MGGGGGAGIVIDVRLTASETWATFKELAKIPSDRYQVDAEKFIHELCQIMLQATKEVFFAKVAARIICSRPLSLKL